MADDAWVRPNVALLPRAPATSDATGLCAHYTPSSHHPPTHVRSARAADGADIIAQLSAKYIAQNKKGEAICQVSVRASPVHTRGLSHARTRRRAT